MKRVLSVILILMVILAGCKTATTTVPKLSTDGPENETWCPAKAYVDNAWPGCKKTVNMRLHNGADEDTFFTIEYAVIEDLMDGYALPPEAASSWMIYPDKVNVKARETVLVPITFTVPKDETELPDKWEFGIRATSGVNHGMINLAVMCTWLVDMR